METDISYILIDPIRFVTIKETNKTTQLHMCIHHYDFPSDLVFVYGQGKVFAVLLDEYRRVLNNKIGRTDITVQIPESREIIFPEDDSIYDMFTSGDELCILHCNADGRFLISTISYSAEKIKVERTVGLNSDRGNIISTMINITPSGLILIYDDGYALLDHNGDVTKYEPPAYFNGEMATVLTELKNRQLFCRAVFDDGIVVVDDNFAYVIIDEQINNPASELFVAEFVFNIPLKYHLYKFAD